MGGELFIITQRRQVMKVHRIGTAFHLDDGGAPEELGKATRIQRSGADDQPQILPPVQQKLQVAQQKVDGNELCKNDSSLLVNVGLDERIPRGLIKYFVEVEHALHLDDIMIRRLRFILTENDCGTLLAEHIAEEMANILGWNQKRIEWEIKRYRTEIKRARVSLY